MTETLGIVWVRSSAGAHWVGQEKAPDALQAAGLTGALEAAGYRVIEIGSSAIYRSALHPDHRHAQNIAGVVAAATEVKRLVERSTEVGALPVVIGGDCTLSIGVMAALGPASGPIGLLYVDGAADLNVPSDSPSGILDSMGVSHMLGLGASELHRIGATTPLVEFDRLVFYGLLASAMNPSELDRLLSNVRRGDSLWFVDDVQGAVAATAATAVEWLEARVASFVVHLDVDVMDYVDFPASNVPVFNAGLSLVEVQQSLEVFVTSPKLAALVVTEYNPDRDPERQQAARLVNAIAAAFARRSQRRS